MTFLDSKSETSLLRDPRLQAYAFGAAPAWLWAADGAQILWSNAAGAAAFGAETRIALIADPAAVSDARMAEVARLAVALPATGASQLARLRAFSNDYGHAALFSCAHVTNADGPTAILIVAAEPPRRVLPLAERARGLLTGETAVAAFGPDGALLYADAQATTRLGDGLRLEVLQPADGADAPPFGPTVMHTYPDEDANVVVTWLAQRPNAGASSIPDGKRAADNAAQTSEASDVLASLAERRQRLRLVWQTDADGRFTLTSDEFLALAGPRTVALLNQPWSNLADRLGLDPDGKISAALASGETWSGIEAQWPIDGIDAPLSVTLSGIPRFDQARSLTGYRGFGICHDVAEIATLASVARATSVPQAHADARPQILEERAADIFVTLKARTEKPALAQVQPAEVEFAEARPLFSLVPGAKNVVALRSASPSPSDRRQALTPVERNAFQEIARALGARFANESSAEFADAPRRRAAPEQDTELEAFALDADADDADLIPEDFVQEISRALEEGAAAARRARSMKEAAQSGEPEASLDEERHEAAPEQAAPAVPAFAPIPERTVLDRLPVAVLVYRANELIYANRAFHDWSGYPDLAALEQAGGFDRLFQAPTPLMAEESEGSGRPLSLRKATGESCCVQAKLFSIQWQSDPALLFVFTKADTDKRPNERLTASETLGADATELVSILDTATDGVVVMDENCRLLSGNRSAQALFGYDAKDMVGRSFLDLFAPESHHEALAYLNGLRGNGESSVLNDGRDVIGRVRQKDTGGGFIPLSMTMGRINDSPTKFCAVFRDVTSRRRAEEELRAARRQAEKVLATRSDFLAKVAHEIRSPLTAIIGFSEAMMEQRFGPVGNERYREYAGDIRTSGEQLITVVHDLLALSKIEAGKLDLTFEPVDLNDLTQECVSFMQAEANRERVIIRVSLAASLWSISADARTLRQIVLNLLANAIKRTGTGGQVIVSTATDDCGSATLRVRDTGSRMGERAVTRAVEPLRQLSPVGPDGIAETSLNLPLTTALAEANGAELIISSGTASGTLVEIAFPAQLVTAK